MKPTSNSHPSKHPLPENWHQLTTDEKQFLEYVLDKTVHPRDLNEEFTEQRTVGDQVADKVAKFGGSWTFILSVILFLAVWSISNTFILLKNAFDPYPYIFLNLLLSMLAAIQAPIIMMSQNRQSKRDRLDAEIDREVNVRSELTLYQMHKKIKQIDHKLEKLLAVCEASNENQNQTPNESTSSAHEKAHE